VATAQIAGCGVVAELGSGAAGERRREILEMNGSAVLLSCWALVGEQDVVAMFQAARDSEYEEIPDNCRDFHAGLDKECAANHFTYGALEENEVELVKLWNWYSKVQARDVYAAPKRITALERSTPAKKHWRSTQPGYMSQRMREARSG
jgi:hypothetical protein